ncbi:leucine-rich repeat-containing protein 3-like [Dreissena polymorpha]|uniref:leucine-rich repeat-containing protein 3-like n=1 Tax=Dreissena polymorpha TaxID=45954 RepID=UPI002264557D|nr:leucine-rich repeat-containing protein 3-like [Dreissena polymorpha]
MSTCKAFVLAVIIALCTGISWGQCPANCTCTGTAVRCIGQQLSTIPLSLPDATLLDLSNNMLASLPDDAFKDWPNLTELDLHGNRIRNISQATFRGLTKLRYL